MDQLRVIYDADGTVVSWGYLPDAPSARVLRGGRSHELVDESIKDTIALNDDERETMKVERTGVGRYRKVSR